MAAKTNPVMDASDYDNIAAVLKFLEQVPGVIAKSKRCGVECTEYERNLEYLVQSLQTMLKEWFPKGRPR